MSKEDLERAKLAEEISYSFLSPIAQALYTEYEQVLIAFIFSSSLPPTTPTQYRARELQERNRIFAYLENDDPHLLAVLSFENLVNALLDSGSDGAFTPSHPLPPNPFNT